MSDQLQYLNEAAEFIKSITPTELPLLWRVREIAQQAETLGLRWDADAMSLDESCAGDGARKDALTLYQDLPASLRAIADELEGVEEQQTAIREACERLVDNKEPTFKYLDADKKMISGEWLQWETMRATGQALLDLADRYDKGRQDELEERELGYSECNLEEAYVRGWNDSEMRHRKGPQPKRAVQQIRLIKRRDRHDKGQQEGAGADERVTVPTDEKGDREPPAAPCKYAGYDCLGYEPSEEGQQDEADHNAVEGAGAAYANDTQPPAAPCRHCGYAKYRHGWLDTDGSFAPSWSRCEEIGCPGYEPANEEDDEDNV